MNQTGAADYTSQLSGRELRLILQHRSRRAWDSWVEASRPCLGMPRRSFLKRSGAALTGAAIAGPLIELTARRARAHERAITSPYGPIRPQKDQSTGLPLIALPDGFEYWSLGWTGDFLDGTTDESAGPTPGSHDGMGVVDQFGSRVVLVRNHEVTNPGPSFAATGNTYSPVGAGGTTTLIWNTETRSLDSNFSSLGGTVRNCAGGVTPWGTWISCEETDVAGIGGIRHGFCFEVSPAGSGAQPIPAMGRFSHEAVAVDNQGRVYLTEDAMNAGLYRYTPDVLGQLSAGGRLQMLAVAGGKNRQFDFDKSFDVPTKWDVEWIDVPAPAQLGTFRRAFQRGAARFTRLEGCWSSKDGRHVFFVSTDGGVASIGQVFSYDVKQQTLTIIFDAPSDRIVDYPDNFTVTPHGGFLFCEDHPATSPMPQRLLGMTPEGRAFVFAENTAKFAKPYRRAEGGFAQVFDKDYSSSEWAGATYSLDGNWLFANLQSPGITLAITGPWSTGPL